MNSNYDYLSALYNRILQLENDLSILKEKSLFHKMFCPKCYRTIPIKDGHIPIITCENCDKHKVENKETCKWSKGEFEDGFNSECGDYYLCHTEPTLNPFVSRGFYYCPFCGKEIEDFKE